ncbi:MAG: hypothetical protein WC498_03780 [Candidatus Saccharimonadales bacterium]
MFLSIALPFIQTFAAGCAKPTFLGLVPWYQYLQLDKSAVTNHCEVTSFNDTVHVLGSQSPFLLIGLAILDDLVRIAGLVAVGFVIYGGIQYITSQGSPDSTKRAQQTIVNALVGVTLAIVASVLVSFIGNKLGNFK